MCGSSTSRPACSQRTEQGLVLGRAGARQAASRSAGLLLRDQAWHQDDRHACLGRCAWRRTDLEPGRFRRQAAGALARAVPAIHPLIRRERRRCGGIARHRSTAARQRTGSPALQCNRCTDLRYITTRPERPRPVIRACAACHGGASCVTTSSARACSRPRRPIMRGVAVHSRPVVDSALRRQLSETAYNLLRGARIHCVVHADGGPYCSRRCGAVSKPAAAFACRSWA